MTGADNAGDGAGVGSVSKVGQSLAGSDICWNCRSTLPGSIDIRMTLLAVVTASNKGFCVVAPESFIFVSRSLQID